MRARLIAAAAATAILAAATATPATADDTVASNSQAETVTLVLPGVAAGDQLPRVEVAAPHDVIAPDGTNLGPAASFDAFVPPAPVTTPAQARRGVMPTPHRPHPLLAPPPANATAPKGSPSRKDSNANVPAENDEMDSLGAKLDAEEPVAEPTLTASSSTAFMEPEDYERYDINDCMSSEGVYGNVAKAMNGLYSCSGSPVTVVQYRCFFGVFCEPVGTASFTMTTIGYANNRSRTLAFAGLMRDFVYAGDYSALLGAPITVSMSCAPTPGYGTACESTYPTEDTRTISEWETTAMQSAYFEWSTPATDGVDADMFSRYDFSTKVALRGGAGGSLTYGAGVFRCDNAAVFAAQGIPPGCVFMTAAERFERLSLTDPEVTQAANHVNTAIWHPELTIPPADYKVIPGGDSTGIPLTRQTDRRAINANRRRSRGACMKYDSNYKQNRNSKTNPLDCDEFPFASTHEGAASGGDFSVRGISRPDNQAAGRRLGDWYNTFRVLDGQSFFVGVRP